MTDNTRLESALRNAHKAGDVEAARALANELKRRRSFNAPISRGQAALTSSAHGVTLGGSDEIAGAQAARADVWRRIQEAAKEGPEAIMAAGRDREAFEAARDEGTQAERQRLAQAREQHPVTSVVSEVAGAIPTALVAPTVAPFRATTTGARMANAAATAAPVGTVYGFGVGEGDVAERAPSAATGAAIAGATGAAIPLAGSWLANRAQNAAIRQNAPTIEGLRNQANAAFQAVDNSGVAVAQPKTTALLGSIRTATSDVRDYLHPRMAGALREIDNLEGGTPSLSQLHNMRRLFGRVAQGSMDADERRLAGLAIEQIDDFVAKLKPSDVVRGVQNRRQAVRSFREGIQIWGRMRRAEAIEDIIQKAELQASGFENGIVIGFRQLLKSPKRLRGFSKKEVALMRQIVKRTSPQAVLRALSRLAPSRNIAGMFGAPAVGGAVGGLPGIAVGAAAVGAGRGVEALAARNARRAADLVGGTVRSGGQVPPPSPGVAQRGVNAIPAAPGGAAGTVVLSPDRFHRR